MAAASTDTRARIVRAAEDLLATHGVDSVSLREISRASGAKNTMALQYHFKDRAGLLEAILAKHLADVDARRHALLDQLDSGPRAKDVRSLAAALVHPLASQLSDPDGGPQFLEIYAEIVTRSASILRPNESQRDSLDRWREQVEPLLPDDAARLHRRFTAVLHTLVELARRARSGPHRDDRLFVSYMVDMVAAMLVAPVSDETRHLADARDEALRDPTSSPVSSDDQMFTHHSP